MKAKLLGIILITAVIGVFTACDNDPKDPTCTCNPKYHGSEDTTNECCGIGTCETFTGKVMANGTKIILDDGVTGVTGAAAEAKINAGFDWITSFGTEFADHEAFARNNIKIIRIIPGAAATNVAKEGSVWVATISVAEINSDDAGLIGGVFYDFAAEYMAAVLFKQMDNSKNTVRMAFGRVAGQRMI